MNIFKNVEKILKRKNFLKKPTIELKNQKGQQMQNKSFKIDLDNTHL